jgi:DNA-binding NarL/FixJ family response regulator
MRTLRPVPNAESGQTESSRATRPDEPVRVLLANDSELVVSGLMGMLEPYGDRVRVTGTAVGDPAIVLTPSLTDQADVLLVDAFARLSGGLDAAAMVLSQGPPFRVAVFTDVRDERLVVKALRLGVSGYLLKDSPAEQLVDALERVRAGETVVDPLVAGQTAVLAVQSLAAEPHPGARLGLTARQGEVLVLLAEGISTNDIARKLTISIQTVRTHLKHIYATLGVNDRAAAVAVAWQEGVARRPTMG